MQDGEVANEVSVDYEPTSVAIHPSKSEFAVGGSMDQLLHVYSLVSGGNFEEKKVWKGPIGPRTCISRQSVSIKIAFNTVIS